MEIVSKKHFDVVKNYDGDTFTIRFKSVPKHMKMFEFMPIRINGIDTPEMRGGWRGSKELAREAQKVVEEKLGRAYEIKLRNLKKGIYSRLSADVIVKDFSDTMPYDLGEQLIVWGFARAYDGETARSPWTVAGIKIRLAKVAQRFSKNP